MKRPKLRQQTEEKGRRWKGRWGDGVKKKKLKYFNSSSARRFLIKRIRNEQKPTNVYAKF